MKKNKENKRAKNEKTQKRNKVLVAFLIILIIVAIIVLILAFWSLSHRHLKPKGERIDCYTQYKDAEGEFDYALEDGQHDINKDTLRTELNKVIYDYLMYDVGYKDLYLTADILKADGNDDLVDTFREVDLTKTKKDDPLYKLYSKYVTVDYDFSRLLYADDDNPCWNVNLIVTSPILTDKILFELLEQYPNSDYTDDEFYDFMKEYIPKCEYSEHLVTTQIYVTKDGDIKFTQSPEELLGVTSAYSDTDYLSPEYYRNRIGTYFPGCKISIKGEYSKKAPSVKTVDDLDKLVDLDNYSTSYISDDVVLDSFKHCYDKTKYYTVECTYEGGYKQNRVIAVTYFYYRNFYNADYRPGITVVDEDNAFKSTADFIMNTIENTQEQLYSKDSLEEEKENDSLIKSFRNEVDEDETE